MNIMKGEVEVPVLNNAHVTYFYYPADSTSFIQAGKDPAALGLSTLHLSCSIFNCFLLLRERLFYVHCSIYCEARWRSSVIFLLRKSCHVQWKKTTLIKHIISAFYEVVLCQMNLLFFHVSPLRSSSLLPSLNNVSIMLAAGQRGRGAEGYKWQKGS